VFTTQRRVADRLEDVWSKLKAGPITGMSTPLSAYCFMNEMPMPPGRKKKTLSAPLARICAISAA
jgi:hypothetical protein